MKKIFKLLLVLSLISATSFTFTSCSSNYVNNAKKESSSQFLERAKEKNDNPIFSWFADTVQYGIENDIVISGNSFGIGFKDNQNQYDVFNPTDWILEKSFNAMDWIMENDVDALKEYVTHSIYDDMIESDLKVVSVLNMYGDINIGKSSDDKIHINLSLIQTKEINDLDIKLENLMLEPQLSGDILFLEPTTKYGENYWDFIINDLNANGIMIEFNILVPSSVQEIRVFNDFGNVTINDIESKITTQVTAGSISGENLSLLDKSTFKIVSGMSNNRAIDLSFDELKFASELVVSSVQGDIYLDLPNNIDYILEVDQELNSQILEKNRDNCLAEFVLLDRQESNLTITTNLDSYFLRQLIIE